MSVGLDLGSTEFRTIRDSGGDLVARRCSATYLVLKDSPGHRRLLERSSARFGTCGDDLVVFGDDAIECAAMLDTPAIPLLREGRLPHADPVARQILALMVEAILPPSGKEGAVCCLTVPGGYGLDGDTQSLDVRFLKQLVTLRGYSAQLISSGHAIVLAELSCAAFSGLGISLGATNCEISVVHCGRELARCTISSPLAELPINAADSRASWEKSCLRLFTNLLSEARESLLTEGSIRLVPQPVNIAVAGGICAAEGFESLFKQAWQQSAWPIKAAETKLPCNPRFSVARGGLIKAILEGQPLPNLRVA